MVTQYSNTMDKLAFYRATLARIKFMILAPDLEEALIEGLSELVLIYQQKLSEEFRKEQLI